MPFANFIKLYVGYSVVIVTKVPLCGYYFPDDDEIVWLSATVLAYPCKRHWGIKQ
ncbi:hypothetical protein IG611_04325 [Pectobacterium sp. A535-S3-A17]|uniref:Uncharacterized protein n=1 Tax=Pectobacterium quasiaquaticum TaxID=2774015 RepID=A0A9Q2EM80_9GAMM|nr:MULTISPECIES: hypothetical protein [Pectobacterium]MBE5215182.1 hypothetical protein [Pectobacterium quasiaquaticum]MBE5221964.1 hypothetical protein [Pectobacterium quasiaquaticum]MBE5224610.1 hypothetical protein [Pectobacterium quasiaquaticum]MBN3062527.1 hypothetical protein [Pectobacterium aquaticum]URG48350.1 hypothetical protein IG609_016490 [Pectobacterium quasiaquaticum]